MKKKQPIILLLLFLFIPLGLTAVSAVAGQRLDSALKGHTDKYARPALTASSVLDGSFQSNLESWWNNHMVPRGLMTKSYNQLRLSLFSAGSQLIAKNGDLFEPGYIDEYLGLDSRYNISTEKLNAYLSEVEEASEKLRALGKALVLYTTPSKCDYNAANIPDSYPSQPAEGYVRSIDLLRQAIGSYNIRYVDTQRVIDEASLSTPVFYPTGIHWARPAEQLADLAIWQAAEEELGLPLKSFRLTDLYTQSTPFYRDNDLWDLLNVWQTPVLTYYEYHTEPVVPADNQGTGLILHGGSFAYGIRKDLQAHDIGPVYYINNDEYVLAPGSPDIATPLDGGFASLDWKTMLDSSKVVMLEMNHEHIYLYSSGFLTALNDALDSYMPTGATNKGLSVAAFDGDYAADSAYLSGVYEYDGQGRAWSERRSSVRLQNGQLARQGIRAKFYVHELLRTQPGDTVTITVNGAVCAEADISAAGDITLVIPPEKLPAAKDGVYTVTLDCPRSFVPAEVDPPSTDMRELSLLLDEIGGAES